MQRIGWRVMATTEPYWREVLRREQEGGKTHTLIPIVAFDTILDRLDFAKSEVLRLERLVDRQSQ